MSTGKKKQKWGNTPSMGGVAFNARRGSTKTGPQSFIESEIEDEQAYTEFAI